MRALIALAFIACSGQAAYAPAPLPQSTAGDVAAFGPGLVAASAGELRVELQRPAYVTVLRVWDDGIELVYPFDPLRASFWGSAASASHQMRFGVGPRRMPLSVPLAGVAFVPAQPQGRLGTLPTYQHCVMRARAAAMARTGLSRPPPPGTSLTDPETECQRAATETDTPQPHLGLSPQRPGVHQVMVILSDARPDLRALSQAVDSLDADVKALPTLAAALLAAQRGPWAAYMTRVD